MILVTLPALVAIVGLLVYAFAQGKPAMVGLVSYGAGLVVVLMHLVNASGISFH
jgi:hypothetical protein